MLRSRILQGFTLCSVAIGTCTVGPTAFAHTRFQTPVIDEGVRVFNNVSIAHGCESSDGGTGVPVIAHSVVFPEGQGSLIFTMEGDQEVPSDVPIGDIISNWGNQPQAIQSHDVFNRNTVVEKLDGSGNVVGFSYRGGKLPGTIRGLVPFSTDPYTFNEGSCARSLKIVTPIADICEVTRVRHFDDSVVNLWTPAVGSKFDGEGLHGFNSPAPLTVNRTSALPPACGEGVDYVIKPSAAQVNRDLSIRMKAGSSEKYWPGRRAKK